MIEAYRTKSEARTEPLTLREREVLQLIAEGKTNKEIAQILDLSLKTIDSHRTRLMEKLGVRGTAGLVRYAVRRGLIRPLNNDVRRGRRRKGRALPGLGARR